MSEPYYRIDKAGKYIIVVLDDDSLTVAASTGDRLEEYYQENPDRRPAPGEPSLTVGDGVIDIGLPYGWSVIVGKEKDN